MSSFEQLFRIIVFIIAGYVGGDALANSAEFQAAVGGAIAIANFAWWSIAHRQAKSAK